MTSTETDLPYRRAVSQIGLHDLEQVRVLAWAIAATTSFRNDASLKQEVHDT